MSMPVTNDSPSWRGARGAAGRCFCSDRGTSWTGVRGHGGHILRHDGRRGTASVQTGDILDRCSGTWWIHIEERGAAGHCPTLGPKVGFAAPPYTLSRPTGCPALRNCPFGAHGSWLTAHSSWLTAHGSRLMAHGSPTASAWQSLLGRGRQLGWRWRAVWVSACSLAPWRFRGSG
jgi:hypothetical protein